MSDCTITEIKVGAESRPVGVAGINRITDCAGSKTLPELLDANEWFPVVNDGVLTWVKADAQHPLPNDMKFQGGTC